MFSVDDRRWPGYSDAVMHSAQANVEALLAGEALPGGEGVADPSCLAMTTESLTREFPLYTPSLLNLVKTSATHVKGLSPQEGPAGEIVVNNQPERLHLCAGNGITRERRKRN